MGWEFFNAAGFLKTNSGRELVSSLPSSPVDGQEVFYQNAGMSTDGIVWHLRYDAASSSANKWEYVGGPVWQGQVIGTAGNSGTSNGVWSSMPTTAVTRTAPLAGDYTVTWGAGAGWSVTAGSSAYLNFSVNNSTPVVNDSIIFETPGGETANIANSSSLTRTPISVTTAGHVLELKFQANSGASWVWRGYYLSILPVRVAG